MSYSYATDSRFPGPDPYAPLVTLPQLQVSSTSFTDGGRFSAPQLGGNDVSPHLSWEDIPEGTKTFAVTCFDPDAPTAAGFWHWAVFNIPATVTELAEGVGQVSLDGIPEAVTLQGDSGIRGYFGPKPPAGHGPHRYLFAVHAVDQVLDLPDSVTPTVLGFNLNFHSLARGIIWGWHMN